MQVMVIEDAFANKLMAMYARMGKTNRDIYDVWFFLKQRFPINKEIIKKYTEMSFNELVKKCIEQLETMNNRRILDGVGELLTKSQKDWSKGKLRDETIALLKLRLEAD